MTAALIVGLLIGAVATYALAGTQSRTGTTTTTLPAITSTSTSTSTTTLPAVTSTTTVTIDSTTTQLVSATTSGNGSQSSSFPCLEEVPDNASVNSLENSSFVGYEVTYANGTQSLFSLDACPVPVTPDLFSIASSIESNPRFIAAEGGAAYEVECCAHAPSGATGLKTNSTGSYAVYMFVLFGSQVINFGCGWTYAEVAGMWVTVPLNGTTGSLDLSRIQVQTIPNNDLNTNYCV